MLKQIADLSAELAAKDHIPVENIMDMVRDVPSTMVQELDIAQKRNLIHEELEKTQERMKREGKAQLGIQDDLARLVTADNLSCSQGQLRFSCCWYGDRKSVV